MIYTFYSFKGGVGRSMALANVAEYLCQSGLSVLMIDFDLEAPGLERYFNVGEAEHKPEDVLTRRGLIDLLISYKNLRSIFYKLVSAGGAGALQTAQAAQGAATLPRDEAATAAAQTAAARDGGPAAAAAAADGKPAFPFPVEPLKNFVVPIYEKTARGGSLHLLPAGRRARSAEALVEDQRVEVNRKELARYAERVRAFAWDDFYANWDGQKFFDWFRAEAAALADVVLLDSRTGFTEMSGICTYHLPDAVVFFVAPNQQNLDGSLDIAKNLISAEMIEKARKGRELEMVFVPSRVDTNEKRKTDEFATQFRSEFRDLFTKKIKFETENSLFDFKIPYVPFYSFIEDVAFRDPTSPIAGLLTVAYEKISSGMSALETDPKSKFRAMFTAKELPAGKEQADVNRFAEQRYNLLTAEEQEAAYKIISRLVQVDRTDAANHVAVSAPMEEFDEPLRKFVYVLELRGLVKLDGVGAGGTMTARLCEETLPRHWERLRVWLETNRDFLIWRQKLKSGIEEWNSSKRDKNALLSGLRLQAAKTWAKARYSELNDAERLYIRESDSHAWAFRLVRILSILSLLAALIFLWQYVERRAEKTKSIAAELQQSEAERNRAIQAKDYHDKGLESAAKEDYATAISLYDSAVALNPGYSEAYVSRGKAYLAQSQYDKAIADLSQAIQLGSDAEGYNYLGVAYRELEKYDSALTNFSLAIQRKADYAEAFYNRGRTHWQMGNYDAAIRDYDSAIALDPNYADAYYGRAIVYMVRTDGRAALSDLRQVIRLTDVPAVRAVAQRDLQDVSRRLGVAAGDDAVSPSNPSVYLYYTDQKDADVLKGMSASLGSFNVRVRGVEFRGEPASGDVRYFYAEDRKNAEEVARLVREALRSRGVRRDVRLVFLNNVTKRVARGVIEVWLPPLNLPPGQAEQRTGSGTLR